MAAEEMHHRSGIFPSWLRKRCITDTGSFGGQMLRWTIEERRKPGGSTGAFKREKRRKAEGKKGGISYETEAKQRILENGRMDYMLPFSAIMDICSSSG
ncbi:MAG: hypothetical protein Q4B85_05115 [Lachnospiraceae bacterium]|nr:hypothetical protein [Lachnospiraceae bacterium]